jgi:hypothetical protein
VAEGLVGVGAVGAAVLDWRRSIPLGHAIASLRQDQGANQTRHRRLPPTQKAGEELADSSSSAPLIQEGGELRICLTHPLKGAVLNGSDLPSGQVG